MSVVRAKLSEHRVDLVLFIFSFASYYGQVGLQNLTLQKFCFPDGPPGTEVLCLDNHAHKQNTFLFSFRVILRDLLSGVVVLLGGSWRDYTGQSRPLALVGNIGEFLVTGIALTSALFWGLPAWVAVIADTVIGGLTGSRALVMIAVLSYVTERTTPQDRTRRMAYCIGAILGSACLGLATGGYILAVLPYPWFFFFVCTLFALNVALASTIKDGPWRNTGESGGPFASVKKLLVIIEPSDNKVAIWLSIIGSCIFSALLSAEGAVSPSFFQPTLHITPKMHGLLMAYKLLISLITCIIVIPLVTKVCKVPEFIFVTVCTIPSAISCFLTAFAKTLTEVYLYYALDMMRVVILAVLYSIITKSVPKTEIGVYTSLLGFGEAMAPLALNPAYLWIFQRTQSTMPGAFFLVSGGFICCTTVLLIIGSCFYKPPDPEEEEVIIVEEKRTV